MSTLKKATLERSAQSIEKYLNTVKKEDLLSLYNSIATKDGIKASDYLDSHYAKGYLASFKFSTNSSQSELRAHIIKPKYGNVNFDPDLDLFAANEDEFEETALYA